MTATVSFLFGVLAGLIANYISPPFKRLADRTFASLFQMLNPDRFDLTGTWEQVFSEPITSDSLSWEEISETVVLRHLGGTVVGEGTTNDNGRAFAYDLRVQHNLVFGSYTKRGARGNLTGNGVIQMIVSPDRLSMKGQATWFDNDTARIESSDCSWQKKSGSVETQGGQRSVVPGRSVPPPREAARLSGHAPSERQ